MNSKIRTVPDLSIDSSQHQYAIKNKEDNFRSWQFNVADKFKGLTVDEIKASLQKTAFPFAVAFENWTGDFNIATGIRNANAFNAKEVFYVGDKKWDRRGAVGVHNYTSVNWVSTIEEFKALSKQYTIIGLDNIPGAVPMQDYVYPDNTLMVFGEEGTGLTTGMQAICKDIVYIEMFGSVRSFNAGSSSAIAMHDLVSKYMRMSNV